MSVRACINLKQWRGQGRLNNPDFINWLLEHYAVYTLVLVRVAAFLFLMPIFSSKTIPVRVKAGAAFVIALVLTPVSPWGAELLPPTPVGFVLLAVAELMSGMILALMIRLVFAGLQTAGQMVAIQMGFSVASVMDPQTGTQSALLAQFVYTIALLLFLATDGHLVILRYLHQSFEILGPGAFVPDAPLYDVMLEMCREMFILSIKILAPVMVILLFSQVALGILAKMVPQINMLIVSFGINIALGLFFLGLSMQVFWPVLGRSLERCFRLMPAAMRVMAGG